MIEHSRLSIVANIIPAIVHSFKPCDGASVRRCAAGGPIARSARLHYTRRHLEAFRHAVGWRGEAIPPTYPYALATHVHFSLVNDARFPLPPLGLIHKREVIVCEQPLRPGVWHLETVLGRIAEVERGFELDLESTLSIDGSAAWRSVTTAFKRTRPGRSGRAHDAPEATRQTVWTLPSGSGRGYARLSNNIDPIHLSRWTARALGHPAAIMHGMWAAARGLSEVEDLRYPVKASFQFVAPIYLPAQVVFQRTAEGFRVGSPDGGTPHLVATLRCG